MAQVTWADLIDVDPDHHVLLIDDGRHRALHSLRSRTDHVHTDSPAAVADSAPKEVYDVICIDQVRIEGPELRALGQRLRPGGRLVLVLDNFLSPLRALDRSQGAWGSAGRWSQRRWCREIQAAGFEVEQAFGLLRSSAAPVTAFDLRAPSSVGAVVKASLNHVGGRRGALLRWLPALRPATVARLSPGWLIVARNGAAAPDPLRVVGKVSNRDSDEVKLIRGEPPAVLERCYVTGKPETAAAALGELAEVGFDLVPRLVGTPSTHRFGVSWVEGDPLEVNRLSPDELVTWVGRTAVALERMQRLTRHADGTVLVHGDLWLGNLLVCGDRITAIIDWPFARRGAPAIDAAFLVESLREHPAVTAAVLSRLISARDQGFAQARSA